MAQWGPERQKWHSHCTSVVSDLIIWNECAQATDMVTDRSTCCFGWWRLQASDGSCRFLPGYV